MGLLECFLVSVWLGFYRLFVVVQGFCWVAFVAVVFNITKSLHMSDNDSFT